MSIKIKASYTTEGERGILERILLPLKLGGARVKAVPGKPYSRIYVELEGAPSACRPLPDVVK